MEITFDAEVRTLDAGVVENVTLEVVFFLLLNRFFLPRLVSHIGRAVSPPRQG